MVVRFLMMMCALMLCSAELLSQSVKVYAYTDSDLAVNKPVMGTLEIEHPITESIDQSSFMLKGEPLAAEQIKVVRYSPNDPLTLTIFRFQLPPMAIGVHDLDSISVKVGNKTYLSVPSKFEVRKTAPSLQKRAGPQTQVTAPPSGNRSLRQKNGKPVLVLEAFVDPEGSLYPGQRTKVGYRYYYDHSINATKEVLPLLDAEGFKKIGGKNSRTAQDDTMSLLEVSQEIEAIKPGIYTFGPSVYEGAALDASGQEIQPQVKSEAAALTIHVIELPEKLKPPSYKNAIGIYTFETRLDSPASVEVGEKMLLRLSIRGSPLDGVELPNICCQPGMAGRFHFNDIPPPPILNDGVLHYVVDIRPIDAEIREIPSLEFSYFNPKKEIYEKVYSNAIPIKVRAIIPAAEAKQAAAAWPKMNTTPKPIRIAGLKPLAMPFLLSEFLLSWWGLLSIPLAAGILFFQVNFEKAWEALRTRQLTLTSEQILERLESYSPDELSKKLKDCFLLKLMELGVIEEIRPYEELSEEPPQNQIKAFLRKVDSTQYTESTITSQELIREARDLYKKVFP